MTSVFLCLMTSVVRKRTSVLRMKRRVLGVQDELDSPFLMRNTASGLDLASFCAQDAKKTRVSRRKQQGRGTPMRGGKETLLKTRHSEKFSENRLVGPPSTR